MRFCLLRKAPVGGASKATPAASNILLHTRRLTIGRGPSQHLQLAAAGVDDRHAVLTAGNPFGLGDIITAMTMDTYVSFDFIAPLQPGQFGPCYEVRTYVLKPGGLEPTIALWRKAVPGRARTAKCQNREIEALP